MTADDNPELAWLEQLLSRPPLPDWEPDVPLCACGCLLYAPDSQAAGACFLCRKQTTEDQAP
jgi:hypothetical protein